MFEKEAKGRARDFTEDKGRQIAYECGFLDGADRMRGEMQKLKELVEKYRQAVDKCLHITFMGGGCEVHTIAQYATLVDGYLIDVEGLSKWKN